MATRVIRADNKNTGSENSAAPEQKTNTAAVGATASEPANQTANTNTNANADTNENANVNTNTNQTAAQTAQTGDAVNQNAASTTTTQESTTTTPSGGYSGTLVSSGGLLSNLFSGLIANKKSSTTTTESEESAAKMRADLEKWAEDARTQSNASIDFATGQSINELQRSYDDSQSTYKESLDQISSNEAKALDNQALYAEVRGDRGGVGAQQYNEIQNTAMKNRLTVKKEQTKLASDMARQIAELRANGEYEKADAALSISQNYLSQLTALEQWALDYQLQVDQFNQQVKQWRANFLLSIVQMILP